MYAIKHLAIGDRVTVIHQERRYSSVVQDMPKPDVILIAQPTSMGVYLNLTGSEEGEILIHKDNGMLTFQVVQEELYIAAGVPMLRLRAVSPVTRSQRRNWFRLDKSLPVQLSVKEDGKSGRGSLSIKARTINISGGGCRIAIRQLVGNDSKLECKFMLSPDTELVLDGQVVWVEQREDDGKSSLIGVQFTDDSPETQKKLVSFLTDEQRKKLKRER